MKVRTNYVLTKTLNYQIGYTRQPSFWLFLIWLSNLNFSKRRRKWKHYTFCPLTVCYHISIYNVEDQFVPENLVFASWWRRYFLFASHKRFISNVIVKVEHKSQTEESVKQVNYKDEFMQQISSRLSASWCHMQLTFNH